jgi:hypothetical protein
MGDDDPVMGRIIDIRKALIFASGRSIDLGRALHVQGFVRTFLVEDLDKRK